VQGMKPRNQSSSKCYSIKKQVRPFLLSTIDFDLWDNACHHKCFIH